MALLSGMVISPYTPRMMPNAGNAAMSEMDVKSKYPITHFNASDVRYRLRVVLIVPMVIRKGMSL